MNSWSLVSLPYSNTKQCRQTQSVLFAVVTFDSLTGNFGNKIVVWFRLEGISGDLSHNPLESSLLAEFRSCLWWTWENVLLDFINKNALQNPFKPCFELVNSLNCDNGHFKFYIPNNSLLMKDKLFNYLKRFCHPS